MAAAAAQAASPVEIPLTDAEEEWGSEVDWAEEEPSMHRKKSQGTRLDDSMEQEQATVKGATKGGRKGQPRASAAASSAPDDQQENKGKTSKVSTKSLSKKEQLLAVTGLNAEFPTLGMTMSGDPVFNMSWVIHGRLIVRKWKQMVWMVRARFALETEGKRYRRHPRWLSMMFAREVAALWGHLGGAIKTLQGPRGPPLMK